MMMEGMAIKGFSRMWMIHVALSPGIGQEVDANGDGGHGYQRLLQDVDMIPVALSPGIGQVVDANDDGGQGYQRLLQDVDDPIALSPGIG